MILDVQVVPALCSGHVRQVEGDRVLVALEDTVVEARLAVAPYRPSPGDEVLLARQPEQAFVIGVLRIAGACELAAPGDLSIRSAGALDLVSARDARLSAPRVSVEASALQIAARSVTERFDRARRWVRECLQLRAGRLRTDVDGTCETQAGRIVQRADRDVKIDGESIDLG